MVNSRILYTLVVVLSLLLSSCASSPIAIQVSYPLPVIPVVVKVNTWGKVSFSTKDGINVPTPIGTFQVGLVVDPTKFFDTPEHDVQTTLTVRSNGVDEFYDLTGMEAGRVTFEPGYYREISLNWRGRDLLLEMINSGFIDGSPTVNNDTDLPVSKRASKDKPLCGDTAFTSGLRAVAVQGVNLRSSPKVPKKWDANWKKTALQPGEKVLVVETPVFNDGFWLRVRRVTGEEGWVKECTLDDGVLVAPE